MTTAWQNLTANSSLPTGTAWDHLNNQVGVDAETIILAEGIEVDTDMGDVVVYIEPEVDFEIEVDLQQVEVEVVMNTEVEL